MLVCIWALDLSRSRRVEIGGFERLTKQKASSEFNLETLPRVVSPGPTDVARPLPELPWPWQPALPRRFLAAAAEPELRCWAGVEIPIRGSPLPGLQSPSSHECPKTGPALRWNRFREFSGFSLLLPLIESSLLFLRHGTGGYRESFTIWKLDNNTEEVPACLGLSEHVVDRIFARSLGALNPRMSEANFFNLFRSDAVPCNVINSILSPDKLINLH